MIHVETPTDAPKVILAASDIFPGLFGSNRL